MASSHFMCVLAVTITFDGCIPLTPKEFSAKSGQSSRWCVQRIGRAIVGRRHQPPRSWGENSCEGFVYTKFSSASVATFVFFQPGTERVGKAQGVPSSSTFAKARTLLRALVAVMVALVRVQRTCAKGLVPLCSLCLKIHCVFPLLVVIVVVVVCLVRDIP